MKHLVLGRLREHVETLHDLLDDFAERRTKKVSGGRKCDLLYHALDGMDRCLKDLSKAAK